MDNVQKPSFEHIFELYKQKIFELVYRMFNNPADAEDIAQEVFLRAYKSYDNFRQESEVYSWLYSIAVNLCREKIRTKVMQRKHISTIISLDQSIEDENGNKLQKEIPDPSCPPAHLAAENHEIRESIKKAIDSLPGKYSEIIILRDIGGLSYEEISKISGLSIDAIGVRLIRARTMLKAKLKRFL